MAEDLGEKTEDPTPKRLSEARERGQVARSQDLSSATLLIGAAAVIYFFGSSMFFGLVALMRFMLGAESLGRGVTTESLIEAVNISADQAMRMFVPFLALMALIAYADQIIQVGWNFTAKALQPRPDKLNPVSGVKRLFSRRSLVKGVVNIVKVAVIGAVAMVVMHSAHDRIIAFPILTTPGIVLAWSRLALELIVWILAALLIIGLIDFAYQRWQHKQDLKMTKQEVKDERKSTEGDPEVKSRRMRAAREMVKQRLGASVPQADVVVTNPTHYAVALQYDAERMNAPRVTAKGADYVAMQIRLIASSHGVPIVERPALARALHRSAEVGQEIPADLYEAVAEVLAYVYRLEGRLAS